MVNEPQMVDSLYICKSLIIYQKKKKKLLIGIVTRIEFVLATFADKKTAFGCSASVVQIPLYLINADELY